LLLVVVYLNAPWFIGPSVIDAIKTAPWLAYLFLVQNLFHLTLPPAIAPTWALAIEEQYYFLWAPLVRFLRRPWMLVTILACALVAPPLLRLSHFTWLTPTHTLIHLDGLALGSLLALGMHTIPLSRRVWLGMGLGGIVSGFTAAATVAGGTAFLDSALAVGFAGTVLAAIASTGARNPHEHSPPPRAARLLRPHQLRPVHDSRDDFCLFRLVRPSHESLRHSRQPGHSGLTICSLYRAGYRTLVRLRVADPQAQTLFLECLQLYMPGNKMRILKLQLHRKSRPVRYIAVPGLKLKIVKAFLVPQNGPKSHGL
jgi:hypothetical protein